MDAKDLEAIEEGLLPEGNKATPVAKVKAKAKALVDRAMSPLEKEKAACVSEYKKLDKAMGLEAQQAVSLVATAEYGQQKNHKAHLQIVLDQVKQSLDPFGKAHRTLQERYQHFLLEDLREETMSGFRQELEVAKLHLEAFKTGAKADLRKLC